MWRRCGRWQADKTQRDVLLPGTPPTIPSPATPPPPPPATSVSLLLLPSPSFSVASLHPASPRCRVNNRLAGAPRDPVPGLAGGCLLLEHKENGGRASSGAGGREGPRPRPWSPPRLLGHQDVSATVRPRRRRLLRFLAGWIFR